MLRLREIREEKGLTQKELAKKLNLDGHNIGDWERGKCEPSISMIIKLSNVLDVSISYLLGIEDDFGNVGDVSGNNLKYADNELTKDEETLLRCFQKCGPFEREAILIQIRALAGEKKEVIKK